MKYYAARAGGYWFDGDHWVEGFENALVCNVSRLKVRLTNAANNYYTEGEVTEDPLKLALLATGGEIVAFELKEIPGEIIPIHAETTGVPDEKVRFTVKMLYEKTKGKKK